MKKLCVVMMSGGLLFISGCMGNLSKGWDAVKLSGHPIVKASGQFDSTLASVVAVAGPPKAKNAIRHGNGGICYDYDISGDGRSSPFYVAFNKDNMTTHYGYITCKEADDEGILKDDRPIKVAYCSENPNAVICKK